MTDCNRCGRCCDPVRTTYHPLSMLPLTTARAAADLALADPRTDEGWAWWMTERSAPPDMDRQVLYETLTDPAKHANADFITEHWTVIDGNPAVYEPGPRLVRCDMFDPHTRLCTAHEDRPPVCSGYPWYGNAPDLDAPLHPTCSYNADVRTALPIVEITSRQEAPA